MAISPLLSTKHSRLAQQEQDDQQNDYARQQQQHEPNVVRVQDSASSVRMTKASRADSFCNHERKKIPATHGCSTFDDNMSPIIQFNNHHEATNPQHDPQQQDCIVGAFLILIVLFSVTAIVALCLTNVPPNWLDLRVFEGSRTRMITENWKSTHFLLDKEDKDKTRRHHLVVWMTSELLKDDDNSRSCNVPPIMVVVVQNPSMDTNRHTQSSLATTTPTKNVHWKLLSCCLDQEGGLFVLYKDHDVIPVAAPHGQHQQVRTWWPQKHAKTKKTSFLVVGRSTQSKLKTQDEIVTNGDALTEIVSSNLHEPQSFPVLCVVVGDNPRVVPFCSAGQEDHSSSLFLLGQRKQILCTTTAILKYWAIAFGVFMARTTHDVVTYIKIVRQIGVGKLLKALLLVGRLHQCWLVLMKYRVLVKLPLLMAKTAATRNTMLTKFIFGGAAMSKTLLLGNVGIIASLLHRRYCRGVIIRTARRRAIALVTAIVRLVFWRRAESMLS